MGPPVVLVHGLSGSGAWWQKILPDLEREREVRVLDLPLGIGLEDGVGWLTEELEGEADLVGHSMGGLIAARVAADRPALVRRLVLIAPAGLAPGSRVRHVVPLLRALRHSSPRLFPLLVRDGLRAGPWTLWRAAGEVLEADIRAHLADIAAPTLVLWGSRDPLVPPSLGEIVRSEIPNAKLVMLERAGHVPMFEASDDVSRALTEFLQ
jgi:pimeloyl-ACP methyl ester carboxylesterase